MVEGYKYIGFKKCGQLYRNLETEAKKQDRPVAYIARTLIKQGLEILSGQSKCKECGEIIKEVLV